MDEKLRALLDQIPEKPPRSKLEQHLEVIRELRRKGRTYQEIAQFFTAHLNLTVAASTIHAFIQVRARRRHPRPQVELPPAAAPALGTQTPASSVSVPTTYRATDDRERGSVATHSGAQAAHAAARRRRENGIRIRCERAVAADFQYTTKEMKKQVVF